MEHISDKFDRIDLVCAVISLPTIKSGEGNDAGKVNLMEKCCRRIRQLEINPAVVRSPC